MSFRIPCPNCGPRPTGEFRFGGETLRRPESKAADRDWVQYFYSRRNLAGEQTEWWYHKFGCRRWLIASRDTITNSVTASRWPQHQSTES